MIDLVTGNATEPKPGADEDQVALSVRCRGDLKGGKARKHILFGAETISMCGCIRGT